MNDGWDTLPLWAVALGILLLEEEESTCSLYCFSSSAWVVGEEGELFDLGVGLTETAGCCIMQALATSYVSRRLDGSAGGGKGDGLGKQEEKGEAGWQDCEW